MISISVAGLSVAVMVAVSVNLAVSLAIAFYIVRRKCGCNPSPNDEIILWRELAAVNKRLAEVVEFLDEIRKQVDERTTG